MKKYLISILITLLLMLTGCIKDNCTVEFVTNCETPNVIMKIERGKKIESFPEITREGYVFDAWYCDGVQWDILENTVTTDLILNARWIEYIGDELQKLVIEGKDSLELGEISTYTVNFIPEYYEDKSVTWSTTDDNVITVDGEGNVTAIGKGKAYLVVQSVANGDITYKKRIVVIEPGEVYVKYPDLQGYEIKIGTFAREVETIDPFNKYYSSLDKEIKQDVWRSVEEDFNCKIVVDDYFLPEQVDRDTMYSYLLSDYGYDFCYFYDPEIRKFAEKDALVDLSNAYYTYGKNVINDKINISAGSYEGKLYTFNPQESNISSVMYYNIGLYEELKEIDPTLQEPAQIFLDKEWTHSKFIEYCEQVQSAMEKKYGEEGIAGGEKQKYFAVSGHDAYWWTGLATNDGVPLANIFDQSINIDKPNKVSAANTVKAIYERGLADPRPISGANVIAWLEGKALFNTGELWFVGEETRWESDLWGEGNTRYGYCPWPRADEVAFEDIQISIASSGSFVMPNNKDYSGFGDEISSETIYYAFSEIYRRTNEIYKNTDNYILEQEELIKKYAHSEVSQKAYIYIQNLIKNQKGYYDPLCVSYNSICDLYNSHGDMSTIAGAVYAYVNGEVSTWSEAVKALIPELKKKIQPLY